MHLLVKFRNSILFLLKVLVVAVLTTSFLSVWQSFYKAARFGGIGDFVIVAVYVGIYGNQCAVTVIFLEHVGLVICDCNAVPYPGTVSAIYRIVFWRDCKGGCTHLLKTGEHLPFKCLGCSKDTYKRHYTYSNYGNCKQRPQPVALNGFQRHIQILPHQW